MKYLLCLLLSTPLIAETPKPTTPPTTPPTVTKTPPAIPELMMKEYYHSLADKLNAQSNLQATPQFKALDQANGDLSVKTQAIQSICGPEWLVTNKPNGDPVCTEKPIVPPPPAPPTVPPSAAVVPSKDPNALVPPVKKSKK